GKRQQQDVDLVGGKRLDQVAGQILPQNEAKLWVGTVQCGQEQRKQIGPDGRNYSKTKGTCEQPSIVPRQTAYLIGFLEHPPGTGDDEFTNLCNNDGTAGPFEECHAKKILQLAQLGAQRGLRDMAPVRGMAEMPQVSNRHEVA